MKKHRIFLILLFFIQMLALRVTAQWSVGLSGGYTFNHYNYDPQYMYGLDFKGHLGIAVDFPVSYQFNEHWGVVSGLSAQQKGYWLIVHYADSSNFQKIIRDDYYVGVPIMAEFTFGHYKWHGFIDAGGYVGYWCKSNFKYETCTYLKHIYPEDGLMSEERAFNAVSDRQFEVGMVGGIGVRYDIVPSFSLFAVVRCHQSLTSQLKDYQTMHFPAYNTTLTGQIGFMFNFKSNKQ